MLVFIDESGCSGFKLARGSDAIFAIGMVIFDDRECALRTERAIQEFRRRRAHHHEIKFSRCANEVRDQFFAAVAGCPFRIRALVVEKTCPRSAALGANHEAFYSFFVRELARRAAGSLRNLRLSIDGSGSTQFQLAMKRDIRRELRGGLASLRMVDSRRDDLVQLADMCVGAVARAFRARNETDRWLRMLESRIEDISYFS